MLLKLSDQISECYRRAGDARAKAAAATDPVEKQELSDMEQRWLFLARGYEFSERVSRFTSNASDTEADSAR